MSSSLRRSSRAGSYPDRRSWSRLRPPRALQFSPMRRRIRPAAFSLHRHLLPQLAVDGTLVALAYWLAYRLRFDGPLDVPIRYQQLFDATIAPVIIGSLLVFA